MEAATELTGPIVRKDARQQIAYAAVLVPGEPDSDGEVLTAEKIEEVAHEWLAAYRNLDLQHSLNNIDAAPVESYVSPVDQEVVIAGQRAILPKGSWIMASKHRDPAVWHRIERGELTGYSVMGVKPAGFPAALRSIKAGGDLTVTFKRTLLRDLGPDWIAPFVSVVDAPAVPKAKWFSLKEAPRHDMEEGSTNHMITIRSARKATGPPSA